jgi:hypothetical protein
MYTTRKEVVVKSRGSRGIFGFGRRETEFQTISHREAVGFWLLESRYWVKRDRTSRTLETTRNIVDYILKTDGRLVVRITVREEVDYNLCDEHSTETEMGEYHVLLLDRRPKHYYQEGRITIDTNQDGGSLRAHAKGVYLSKMLKSLLAATP